ncbi:hypothetical protein [Halogeometricum luteum]|jgi:hypothetical protein|uniref:Uncharacterized protein n=1 Tax=Halogeometricum luteum TaxID=2950537 RepID=A0ABU2G744_9EURY|nr:hypothetical protein [Halogeometricum sp. S3BR5-2]MDS0296611.1 hypothetical protein [Halogeometricum sp. S3BR5-2]
MTATHELFPFHEDSDVAAALGTLLVQRGSVDPEKFNTIANRFNLDPNQLEVAAIQLGIEDEILGVQKVSDDEAVIRRNSPDFLNSRESVTREYDGVRDSGPDGSTTRTNEMSFQSWLLVEATKIARETIKRLLYDHLGDEAKAVRVSTQAAVGTAEYPERVLWVGVSYPVDKSEPRMIPAVSNPPSFPFDRLVELLPETLDTTVEYQGKTFHVRNIPVVPFQEPHYH